MKRQFASAVRRVAPSYTHTHAHAHTPLPLRVPRGVW